MFYVKLKRPGVNVCVEDGEKGIDEDEKRRQKCSDSTLGASLAY